MPPLRVSRCPPPPPSCFPCHLVPSASFPKERPTGPRPLVASGTGAASWALRRETEALRKETELLCTHPRSRTWRGSKAGGVYSRNPGRWVGLNCARPHHLSIGRAGLVHGPPIDRDPRDLLERIMSMLEHLAWGILRGRVGPGGWLLARESVINHKVRVQHREQHGFPLLTCNAAPECLPTPTGHSQTTSQTCSRA